MDAGTQLRHARQQAGLSREEIAQSTKIQLAKIDALESNAFERLPDGVYLDGIVKAYALAVGLDAAAMVEQVHAEREGRGDEEPDEVAAPTAAAAPASDLAPTGAHPYDMLHSDVDLIEHRADVAHDSGRLAAAHTRDFDFDHPAALDDRVSREMLTPERANRRSSVPVVLAILALLGASALGGYMYESWRRAQSAHAAAGAGTAGGGETGAAGAPGAVGAADAPSAAAAPRTSGTERDSGAAGDGGTGVSGVATPSGGDVPLRPNPSSPGGSAADERQAAAAQVLKPPATGAPETPSAAIGSAPAAAAAADAPGVAVSSASPADLSGVWTLDTRIESSSYRDYEGLQLGYRLEFQQDGSRVTGTGIKTLENGRKLGGASQTPILLQGTIDGERLTLTFTERGTQRTTDGRMVLEVYGDGVLRGRFASSAARSSGTAEARRPEG